MRNGLGMDSAVCTGNFVCWSQDRRARANCRCNLLAHKPATVSALKAPSATLVCFVLLYQVLPGLALLISWLWISEFIFGAWCLVVGVSGAPRRPPSLDP